MAEFVVIFNKRMNECAEREINRRIQAIAAASSNMFKSVDLWRSSEAQNHSFYARFERA